MDQQSVWALLLLFLIPNTGCAPSSKTSVSKPQIPTRTTIIHTPTPYPKPTLKISTIVVDSRMTISGYVIKGGDTTPDGLINVPRIFEYQIETDDGLIINLTYTAFPPSPIGNKKNNFDLDFHAGEIQTGDYLQARGDYYEQNKTLTISEEGDFIHTYPEKP